MFSTISNGPTRDAPDSNLPDNRILPDNFWPDTKPDTGYPVENAWVFIILTLWDVLRIELGIFFKKEIENRTSHSRDIEF